MLTFHTEDVVEHCQEALSKTFSPQGKSRSLSDKTYIFRSHQFTHLSGVLTQGACDAVREDPMLDIEFETT